MQTKEQQLFLSRLRFVAKKVKHADLADRLGIGRACLRNWIYRKHDLSPNTIQMRAIGPALNREWTKLK